MSKINTALVCLLGGWCSLLFVVAGFMHKWRAMAGLMMMAFACVAQVVYSERARRRATSNHANPKTDIHKENR